MTAVTKKLNTDIFGMKEIHEKTRERFENPRQGDVFTEMYSFFVYVVRVTEESVFTVEVSQADAEEAGTRTLPDCGWLHRYTLGEFKTRFAYGSIDGFWVAYSTNTDVEGWFERMIELWRIRND